MKEKKIESISLIKSAMMMFVVLYHSMMFFSDKWFTFVHPVFNAKYLYKIALFLNTFHIQTFTMVSGFLFYYLKSKNNHYVCFKNDIKKRAKRLLIPYLFASVFWVIPITILFYNYSFWDIITSFLFMASPSQLWFLIMLFTEFVIFDLLYSRIKINKITFLLIFIFSVLVGNILSYYGINYFQISKSIHYILFFYLGGYIYENKEKISLKQTIIMIISVFVLFAFVMGVQYLGIKSWIKTIFESMISVLEVSIIFFIFTKLQKHLKNSKLLKIVEQNNFGIFLFHQQIIYFTIVLFNGMIHPIVQVFLSFLISLMISILITIILKKKKTTSFLFGL